MGYVKVVKNRNYYKRFKVKMRRRRECKTDYAARRRMIQQDKRKYNALKWRFIVRITNTDVICQVAAAKMIGDQILCAAYSHELKRYGLTVGLTNYAACYCTGLLLARRLNKKLGLDKFYKGKTKLDGGMFMSYVANVQWEAGQKIFRPFKCILDVGLARTTTGARLFGALKGAVDGGLNIPHSPRRFPGFKKGPPGKGGKGEDEYDPKKHRDKIVGGHVKRYMEHLQREDSDKYEAHFSRYIAAGIGPENLEETYEKVHAAIRANPSPAPKKKKTKEDIKRMQQSGRFPPKMKKLTLEQRKQRRAEKIAALAKQGQDEDDNVIEIDGDDE